MGSLDERDRRDTISHAIKKILVKVEPGLDSRELRQGLMETPDRVAKAWEFWTSGYSMKAEDILKVFEDGGETYDEMVMVTGIPVYSHCEHHLASIFGTATVAYIPDGKIVGLSKLSRLVDMHARRLQVQERLTADVAEDLWAHLKPLGVGVMIRARHM
ncbi:MAG: GTP cyclohydrolase I, partial [Beijerinckiaceae bacterium]